MIGLRFKHLTFCLYVEFLKYKIVQCEKINKKEIAKIGWFSIILCFAFPIFVFTLEINLTQKARPNKIEVTTSLGHGLSYWRANRGVGLDTASQFYPTHDHPIGLS